MKRDFQIKFLLSQNLTRDDVFLDIGCGTLRGGIPIIAYLNSNRYHGIDVRENVIVEAKNEVEDSKLLFKKPTLISFKNFDLLHLDPKFDKIFAFSVLIHLDDLTLDCCFHFVSRVLKENGIFYANVNLGNESEGRWLDFPIVYRPLEFYAELATKYNLSVGVIASLKDLGHITGKKSDEDQYMLKITKL